MLPHLFKDRRSLSGYPPRLIGAAAVLNAAAVAIAAGALVKVATSPPGTRTLVGVGVFFALALLAELKPVPLDEGGNRLVSLAFVFVVSAQILFGWQFGVLVGTSALAVAQICTRTPAFRGVYNVAVYAISAFAAALPALILPEETPPQAHLGFLTAISFLEAAIFVGLNVLLVCLAIALYEGVALRGVVADHLKHSGPAFAIMAFIAALAVALWTVWPPLLILLAGPVFALALFQRYALSTKVAQRAAATDSLTELKNHRSYEAEAVAAVARSRRKGRELALCLLDIDDFKAVNDLHGHPVGDRILVDFAKLLRGLSVPAEAYRLGGDEFVLIVEGGEAAAVSAVEELRERLLLVPVPGENHVTVSAGIACYPTSGETVDELQRVADIALYWTKRHGKDRSCVYSPSVVELSWPAELAATVEYHARLRATENLIRVVDARDTYTGSHSLSVAVLSEAIGQALGLSEATVKQLRVAGLLHDLGKIAVPDDILQNPGPLGSEEFTALRRHSQTGFELLQGLDVYPVDRWILHHHEHFDGTGYPQGLKGEEIPVGSRIILVADAFDAMTTERCYRHAISVDEAIAELRRNSGTQFDSEVVAALERSISQVVVAARSHVA